MKRAFLGGLALALVVAACATDPTADLGPSVTRVTPQYTAVTLAAGDSIIVTAQTVDGQNVMLSSIPQAASADQSIATVSNAYLPPLPIARFYITGVAAGSTQVNVTDPTSGATAAIAVVVN
jgi:hypothetical protein